MKEIKAYVRPSCLDSIITELEKAGAKDLTVVRVDALGALADQTETPKWNRRYEEKYSASAKLEIVCMDEQAQLFVTIIQQSGRLGMSGDGRIFVSNIEKAVNIRTGEEGEKAL